MATEKVKIVTADELAHGSSGKYLKTIYKVYKTHGSAQMYTGNKGGVQEDFKYTPKGVLWYFGEWEDHPKRFVPNEVCKMIPKMIRDKKELMDSLDKHYKNRRG